MLLYRSAPFRHEAKWEQRFAQLETRVLGEIAGIRSELANTRAYLERRLGDQTRWLFVAWASLLIPIIGLWMR